MERLVTLRDHVGAALLFAINNLAITINALRAHGAKDSTIQLISDMDRRDFTELIAAFHNRPTDAAKGVTAWVKAGGSAPFHTFCPETVKTYAERSGTHYDKVQERLQRAY
jgi:hypothetical protein